LKILGISCFYHDSGISLIEDGEILFAAQEERFSRVKQDASFPYKSIENMLTQLNLDKDEIDVCVFYEKPLLKFDRLLSTYLHIAPKGFKSFNIAIPEWVREKLFFRSSLKKNLKKSLGKNITKNIYFSEHHYSHAASAYFPSPFNEATVLTVDGVGEWATTTISHGIGGKLNLLKEVHFPHSLGLLYSSFTQYCGFRVNSGEYKLMGLAPYGKPIYKDIIYENLIKKNKDGSFELNLEYFNFLGGLEMINNEFENLFNLPARTVDEDISLHYCDVASSIQEVLEEILIDLVNQAVKLTGVKDLVLAGGVALNCVANKKILEKTNIDNLWIQPASGDAGGSLGAALAYYYKDLDLKNKNEYDTMQGAYLGTSYSNKEIETELKKQNLIYKKLENKKLYEFTAKKLSEGKIIGRFDGRMEFGPRALGNRSILADPRNKEMQSKLNRKIKFRESFRPFAPSVLEDYVDNYFDTKALSPYMLLTSDVKNVKINEINSENLLDQLSEIESLLPAITHVDGSARIQTVSKQTNQKYYDLINEFYKITNCPILVNTSFNVRGEPIVESPVDAIRCFLNTNIDVLSIGNFVVNKSDQNIKIKIDYEILPGLD
tara:strand:- start:807 stop:2621 length:1815 start_codon:yes stop_codon:yes gene_type:complete